MKDSGKQENYELLGCIGWLALICIGVILAIKYW